MAADHARNKHIYGQHRSRVVDRVCDEPTAAQFAFHSVSNSQLKSCVDADYLLDPHFTDDDPNRLSTGRLNAWNGRDRERQLKEQLRAYSHSSRLRIRTASGDVLLPRGGFKWSAINP
jgi:hypothetical protein